MLFTSYEFIAAAALVFTLYYLIPKRYQWKFLLVVSYLFYWQAGRSRIFYILVTTLVTYYGALRIGKLGQEKAAWLEAHKKTADREGKKRFRAGIKKRQKVFFLAALLLDLGLLVVMKYTNFFIENVNGVIGALGRGEYFSIRRLPD